MERFAEREPFFTVVPADQYLRANLTPAREREFYAAGETLVSWMFDVLDPLAPGFEPVTALEFGCGIGRLALPLAAHLGELLAVEPSPSLRAHAAAEAARRGLTNITFAPPADFFSSPRKFDLVLCHLPLQRMVPAEGLTLVRRLIDRIGPGGVGIFHFPFEDTTTTMVRASRWLRWRLPAFNRVTNQLRGKPADERYIPTHTYPLMQMLATIRDTPIAGSHVALDKHSQPARATLFLQMPYEATTAASPKRRRKRGPDVDVKQLIAGTSIDELNRKAEEYFSTLTDWDHHLAKPFAKPEEVPPLLQDTAILMQGLKLEPGQTVLEFGAGSGWLSRYFTQLGCRAVLLDVSPTALRMAESLYARLPVIGDQPSPQFLLFSGRHIDLPDASVDRIVSFHAFHHVPNPDDVLREFGRVLRPGGIAAFAEPGLHHSRSALSQFEMRTYGVVENDVDIHHLWKVAQANGFADMKLAVYHQPPFHVSLAEFDDILTGGPVGEQWLASTRRFLRNVRTFFLIKSGAGHTDSRSTEGLMCRVQTDVTEVTVSAGSPVRLAATVANTGSSLWLPWPDHGGVALGAHLYDAQGNLLNFDFYCLPLTAPTRPIPPGEFIPISAVFPALDAGTYRLELDCVASGVTWFAQVGARPVTVTVHVN